MVYQQLHDDIRRRRNHHPGPRYRSGCLRKLQDSGVDEDNPQIEASDGELTVTIL